MKCPICNVELKMTERQNIEIDYCPQCRGVWLDRGELDKLIERSASTASHPFSTEDGGERYHNQKGDHDERNYKHFKKKKHQSLLSELFDFD